MRLHRLVRNRVLGLSRRLVAPVAQWRAAREAPVVRLADVRRRLELLVAAMYGERAQIVSDGATPPDGAVEGWRIMLPARMEAGGGEARAMERYRLSAVDQAERLARGTAPEVHEMDALEHDLYAAMEGALVDHAIAQRAPGLAPALDEVRRAERVLRPGLERVKGAEGEVERLVQTLLAADVADEVPGAATLRAPSDTARWARVEAARIRAGVATGARYRGAPSLPRWRLGRDVAQSSLVSALQNPMQGGDGDTEDLMPNPGANGGEAEGEGEGGSAASDDDSDARAAEADEGGGEDDRAPTPGAAGAGRSGGEDRSSARGRGVRYREWDEYAGRYKVDGVTVRDRAGDESDGTWAATALAEHAPLVRGIRARFESLRAQRVRLRAQRAGDELDLDACVAALVDRRMGRTPSDRLYLLTQPARRSLAIALLVDASGSTDVEVADGRRVIDVERLTVLLAGEALDALGDPYAVLAFSGCGRHDVELRTIKGFAERDRAAVHRRLGALVPMDNTRLGAAVRHATAVLGAQPAERRLLLLVSDGRPNDVGGYQGSYAVEDSRRAVLEARASGVHTFCLTVDREETEYLPRLFGEGGYRIMREPAQLPAALLRAVTRLLPA